MYQRFQHFNHANMTICGGAAGAGCPQLPLCGAVRRLRENQREIPGKEHGSGTWGDCGARVPVMSMRLIPMKGAETHVRGDQKY